MAFYNRKSPRIPGYDYSTCNYYFVTICTDEHGCLFGLPGKPNACGIIAEKMILQLPEHYDNVKIDKYVVMPNHIHMILVIGAGEKNPNLNQIVGQYKSGVSREIHKFFPDKIVWQRSFHDHVIRNQSSYDKIWMYIENNPLKWEEDCFYRQSL